MGNPIFTSLRLQNFRSFEDFAVELSPRVNIVVGPNASGKTNLLESLLVVCGHPSYRTSYDNLIKNDKQWSRMDSHGLDETRVVKLKIVNDTVIKTYEINEKPKKRLAFLETIPIVLFEPDDMRLLIGPPEVRREYFDSIIAKTSPSFLDVKSQYKRALAQRNRLLKMPDKLGQQIFAWNVRLSQLAGKLVEERLKLLQDVNKHLTKTYLRLANSSAELAVGYSTNLDVRSYESSMIKALEKSAELDLARGYTHFGPHREDYLITIEDKPAEVVASRGETRTLVLSLKLIEIKILEEVRKQKPAVLLDDVFSELDGFRRQALTKYLDDYQVIITTTDADVIQKNFAQSTNRISL